MERGSLFMKKQDASGPFPKNGAPARRREEP